MSICQYTCPLCDKILSGDGMDYIDKLISLRIDRDLTQADVARVINKSQQGYDHIEKRRARLTIEDMIRLCDFYQMTPNELLGYE